jgi:DNA polymerase III epsilon subunit-like protein
MSFGTVFDLEADSLTPTKIHCVVTEEKELLDTNSISGEFSKPVIWVGHNICRFDIPVIERLTQTTVPEESTLCDTLAICWYLWGKPKEVGLKSWGEYFGIPKPEITDWEGLSLDEYLHRCREDVKINKLLWEKQYKELRLIYKNDDDILSLCRYLSFKMKCARLQEESKWLLDRVLCEETIKKFEKLKQEKIDELFLVMPKVPITSVRRKPKRYLNGDGPARYIQRISTCL